MNRIRAVVGIVRMLFGKVEDLSWVFKVSVVSWGAKNAQDTLAEEQRTPKILEQRIGAGTTRSKFQKQKTELFHSRS